MKTLDFFYYTVQSAAVAYMNFIRLLVSDRSGGGGTLVLYFSII